MEQSHKGFQNVLFQMEWPTGIFALLQLIVIIDPILQRHYLYIYNKYIYYTFPDYSVLNRRLKIIFRTQVINSAPIKVTT